MLEVVRDRISRALDWVDADECSRDRRRHQLETVETWIASRHHRTTRSTHSRMYFGTCEARLTKNL